MILVAPVSGVPAGIHFSRARATSNATTVVSSGGTQSALKSLLGEVASLRRELENLQETFPKRGRLVAVQPPSGPGGATTPVAVSLASPDQLGLDLTGTAASADSFEEVNDIPTSYTPFGPTFSGTSTSLPTISGVFNGSGGNDTLTFRVTRAGNVGRPYTGFGGWFPASLRVEVRRGNGTLLQNINFNESTAPETQFTLSNGLVVSFAAGSLRQNNSFTVAVSTSTPSAVDPDLSMNGVRNNNPNLQPGSSVTNGSFTVNGVSMAVSASDTINDVLDRITASEAGVTATYDAGTDSIVLAQKTAGAASQIVFADDTSGFLAAMKLDGAVITPGTDGGLEDPIASVVALSEIGDGTFSINGVQFNIATATDSLADVIAAINSSSAGVAAAYDSDTITLTSLVASASIDLDDGTSGFFIALGLATGRHEPGSIPAEGGGEPEEGGGDETVEHVTHRRVLPRTAYMNGFKKLGGRLGTFFAHARTAGASFESRSSADLVSQTIKSILAQKLGLDAAALANESVIDTGLGFLIDLSGASDSVIVLHDARFQDTLRNGAHGLVDFAFSDRSSPSGSGLFTAIDDALAGLELTFSRQTDSTTGLLLDAFA